MHAQRGIASSPTLVHLLSRPKWWWSQNICSSLHHVGLSSNSIRSREYRMHQVSRQLPCRSCCSSFHRYWGKRDTALILPTNSSLSVTLSQDHLRSTTSSRADASFEQGDRLWLNGKEEEIKAGGRTATCLAALRKWRKEVEDKSQSQPKVSLSNV